MKTEFINEVNKIKDESLKAVALKMVEDAPKYFFISSSEEKSSSNISLSESSSGQLQHLVQVNTIQQLVLEKVDLFVILL